MKGSLHAAAGIVLAVAGCGGASIGVGSEPLAYCARAATVQGIDVSHYDGTIDWAAVAGAGIGFAFLKATEGTTFVDAQLAANWKGAAAHGLVRGAYHFFRPALDPVAQADFFVATTGVPAPGDLPPVLDLEATDNLTAAQVADGARTFLQRVAALTGRTPIVYTSARFFGGTLGSPAGFDGYTLWDAQWTTACPNVPSPPWSSWTFWQYSATGTVAGISGMANVDLDEFDGTLDELHAFAGAPASADGGADGGSVDAGAPPNGLRHGGCQAAIAEPAAHGGVGVVWFAAMLLAAARRRRCRSS